MARRRSWRPCWPTWESPSPSVVDRARIVLVADGAEGVSADRRGISILEFVRRAKAPELPVVLEDIAALIGLMLALVGVSAAVVTDNGVFDGIGTVFIGVLLIAVALLLVVETKSLLIGEGASAVDAELIRKVAEAGDDVDRIIHMKTLYLGPDELMVAMKVAVQASKSASDVAAAINAVERRVGAAVPVARVLYSEPDVFHPEDLPADAGAVAGSQAGVRPAADEAVETGAATPDAR